MFEKENTIKRFEAKNLAELLKIIDKTIGIKFVGGCTAIKTLPQNFICTKNIPELKKFEKWDTNFSIGPELTLTELEEKGEKNLPPLIFGAIKTIANHPIRNMATLAGNLFAETNGVKHTLYAPFLALDTRFEFTRAKGELRTETKSIQMIKLDEFNSKNWVLTKLRIPNNEWNIQIFKRLGSSHFITDESASFVFLADIQDDIIASIRIAFAGKIVFRNLDFENKLTGLKIPLSENYILERIEQAEKLFESVSEAQNKKISEFTKAQFLNLIRFSLEKLI